MKKILALFLSIAMILCMSVGVLANEFVDVENHKNEEAIEVLNTLEIVNGYNETNFGPDDILTRAQLCTMLSRAIYNKDLHYNNVNVFTDVEMSHWARMYIDTAYRNGLMVGYGNNTFGPEDNLTYTQTARTILNALGYGVLSWPDGVNLVALELGLYEDINVVNYETGCTRAHAAQMIYNAFELELVKDYAGIPMRTGKTFLNDLLGYVETTEVDEGHSYLAYHNVAENIIYCTDIVLTSEVQIYSADKGASYRLEDSTRSKKFAIDWEVTPLYVNDTIVDKGMKTWLKDSDLAFGIFDNEDNLIAIRVINPGLSYVPATGLNEDKIPEEILEEIQDDEDFDERLSTVTYYEESGVYEISNDITAGFITRVTRTSIYVDDVIHRIDNSYDFDPEMFVVIYYDVHGLIADIMVVENPYFYSLRTETYHTWECEIYNDRPNNKWWANSEEEVIEMCLDMYGDDITRIRFNDCDHCHTVGRLTIRIEAPEESIPEVETPTTPEPTVTYVSADGWDYYHTEDCPNVINENKETFVVDIATTPLLRHDCCN